MWDNQTGQYLFSKRISYCDDIATRSRGIKGLNFKCLLLK